MKWPGDHSTVGAVSRDSNSSNKAKGAELDHESFGISSLFTAPLALGHRSRSPHSYCWALLRKSLPGERVLVPQDSGQELHGNLAPPPSRASPALLQGRGA